MFLFSRGFLNVRFFFIISINKESKVSYSATIRMESLKLVTLKPKVPLIISYVQYCHEGYFKYFDSKFYI